MYKSAFGFSLLELMITIFILSLTTMFIVPTYQNYMLKTTRMEAKVALYDLANRLENHYHKYKTYQNATIASGQITDILATNISANKNYVLNIIAADKNSYILQAKRVSEHVDKECQCLTLSSTGSHGDDNLNNCW